MLKILGFVVLASTIGAIKPAYAQDLPFIAAIPVTRADQDQALSESINLSYKTSDPAAAYDHFLGHSATLKGKPELDSISLSINKNLTLPGLPKEKHSKSSFVIDLDEDSTQSFLAGFTQQKDQNAELLANITLYANQYIQEPTYIHGFLIASRVAKDKTGDCTEYAVLTTALSRNLGLPARFITGVVIIEDMNGVQAFGHAWTETWLDDQWHIVDAAMLGIENSTVFYLPVSTLENEGPGYYLSMLQALKHFPSALEDLENNKAS